MSPSVLESQLAAQIEKITIFFIKGKLLNACQVIIAFLFFLEMPFYILYLIPLGVCTLDDVEFPLCCIEMGSAQDTLVKGVVSACKI